MDQFFTVLVTILLPILVIVGLGALVQRSIPMQVSTLATINLYIFVPVYLLVQVSESDLRWSDIGMIGLAAILPMITVGALLIGFLRWAGWSRESMVTILVGGLFANAGNFGVPVAELAFGVRGAQVQSLLVMFANLSVFLGAYGILLMGQGQGWRSMLGYFRMPHIYVLVAAVLLRDTALELPGFVTEAAHRISGGMVPIALLTLGAQLSAEVRWPRWHLVGVVVVIQLLVLPLTTLAFVWGLGIWPWPGQQIVLSAAGPAAVNVVALAIELRTSPHDLADCVFWTTLASLITVPCLLTLLGGP